MHKLHENDVTINMAEESLDTTKEHASLIFSWHVHTKKLPYLHLRDAESIYRA